MSVAARPNEPLAFAGALAILTHLGDTAKLMAVREKLIEETETIDPVVVTDTPDAKRKIIELKFNCDEITRRLMARNGGQIDRSTLLRILHIDSQMLQKIILTLHMCDMIEEEQISARKVIYTLKVAA